MPGKSIRISGVVRVTNQVRKQLAAGIPPEKEESFRKLVRETTSIVETLCRQTHIQPDDLPAPTYRAYRYLKEIDLKHLPKPVKGKEQAPAILRIPNLVAITNDISEDLWAVASQTMPSQEGKARLAKAQKLIAEWVGYIQGTFSELGSRPFEMTQQGRRAYQWLRFLNEAGNFKAHNKALQILARYANDRSLRKSAPAQIREFPLVVSIYHFPALYKVKVDNGKIELNVNEGYIHAPENVLRALAGVAFQGKQPNFIERLREYSVGEDFSDVTMELEMEPGAVGAVRSEPRLERSFQRVNRDYFQGKLEQPHLTWNQTITHRKFGHYVPSTDTVMISQSLDRPDVPEYVLDFVMYHELLHKQLGTEFVNGRAYAHTPAFRQAEQRYPKHAEANAYLAKLGKNLSL